MVDSTMRAVRELVDGNGIYCSRVAAGGPFAFFAGSAVDAAGAFPEEASVKPPYHHSASAHCRAQTQYVLERCKAGLAELGSSMDDVVQVEQYLQRKSHCEGYTAVSRGPGFLERGRPGSALICSGDFVPERCVVTPTGIAVVDGHGMTKEILAVDGGLTKRPEFGEAYAEEPIYNEIVTAGPYVFTVGDWSCDYHTGIRPEIRAPDWIWWGEPIRNEAQFLVDELGKRLALAGSELADVVHATHYLIDIGDQYELDLVWRERFPVDPPARTVVPVRGLGIPRTEEPRSHAENGMRMEGMCQSLRPGFGVEKEVIGTGAVPLAHESEAIRARPLLWTSGLLAGDAEGPRTKPDAPSQIDYLLRRLDDICQAGGTTLQNLLRLRVWLTEPQDGYAFYAALKAAVPADPPCVAMAVVPGPLQVPGCTVMVDAVAYAPEDDAGRGSGIVTVAQLSAAPSRCG